MEDFSTSLVREKIILIDEETPEGGAAEDRGPTVIRSNRIYLKLGERAAAEKVVVRAQNMHTALRLASKLLFIYYKHGLFLERTTAMEWDKLWDSVVPAYEKEFNPDIWSAVYINGKPIFKTTTSPFVDVIEKCALLTLDNYDATMDVTQDALKQVGRAMRISHSSNVAAVLSDNGEFARCGIIHRSGRQDTTFSFTAENGQVESRIVQSMSIAAAFLEAINLQFVASSLQLKLKMKEIPKVGPEANQLRGATARLVALDKGIMAFEDIYAVKYRPEKPKFFNV